MEETLFSIPLYFIPPALDNLVFAYDHVKFSIELYHLINLGYIS